MFSGNNHNQFHKTQDFDDDDDDGDDDDDDDLYLTGADDGLIGR